MAALTPRSTAAIARLRNYVPPPASWHSLPLAKRAAVLILLFADRRGELRVVLTMRAATLKSFAGQAALPGGKSDTLDESPLQTARREAFEEIGLPLPSTSKSSIAQPSANDTKYNPPTTLPYPFQLDHLCQLPTHLAKTELGVRPCVAFLSTQNSHDRQGRPADAETMLIPRLDAKEVAAVFSAPLHNFLTTQDEMEIPPMTNSSRGLRQAAGYTGDLVQDDGKWYEGLWTPWHNTRFRMHNFYVPVGGQTVTYPKLGRTEHSGGYPQERSGSTLPYSSVRDQDEDPLARLSRFRVWGMTARILVDCARIAYAETPGFEVNKHLGDEQLIGRLMLKWEGQMRKQQREAEEEDPGGSYHLSEVGGNRQSRNGRL